MKILNTHKITAYAQGDRLTIYSPKGTPRSVPIKQLHAWIARKHKSAPADITHAILSDGSIYVTSPESTTTIEPADLERWLLRIFRRESQ